PHAPAGQKGSRAMPMHRALIRPSDQAISAAHKRAHRALTCILAALGTGTHTLNYVAQDSDGQFATVAASITLPPGPTRLEADPDDVRRILAALTFAIEGSCVNRAVLVATTQMQPQPRACGWSVRDGWLHPMPTAELQQALAPCPGTPGPARETYAAPALNAPPRPAPAHATEHPRT
ncbi:hypothetical protein, partial [Streptomyces lunaelactis]